MAPSFYMQFDNFFFGDGVSRASYSQAKANLFLTRFPLN